MNQTGRGAGIRALPPAALAVAMMMAPSPGLGQQGHPLAGSWHGEWGPPGNRMDLTVIMNWDGRVVTGLVNPVTDRTQVQNVVLDSRAWTVRFEVEVKGPSDQALRCVADGQLERLGSDRRTLTGSWICGDLQYEFEMTRDRDY